MDAINIAAAGMSAAANRLTASAQRTVAGGDLAVEAVEQITAKHAFSASISVLKTGDEMLRRLLDIRA